MFEMWILSARSGFWAAKAVWASARAGPGVGVETSEVWVGAGVGVGSGAEVTTLKVCEASEVWVGAGVAQAVKSSASSSATSSEWVQGGVVDEHPAWCKVGLSMEPVDVRGAEAVAHRPRRAPNFIMPARAMASGG